MNYKTTDNQENEQSEKESVKYTEKLLILSEHYSDMDLACMQDWYGDWHSYSGQMPMIGTLNEY